MRTAIRLSGLYDAPTRNANSQYWAGPRKKQQEKRQLTSLSSPKKEIAPMYTRVSTPFSELHWAVKYKIDGGELIEVWHPGKNIPVLEGMHGMLTYSTHPEIILNFRVVQQNLTK
jgi:hypothetical protein